MKLSSAPDPRHQQLCRSHFVQQLISLLYKYIVCHGLQPGAYQVGIHDPMLSLYNYLGEYLIQVWSRKKQGPHAHDMSRNIQAPLTTFFQFSDFDVATYLFSCYTLTGHACNMLHMHVCFDTIGSMEKMPPVEMGNTEQLAILLS